MTTRSDLEKFRIVRLNATLFPISRPESELYRKFNLNPLAVEANIPEKIIPHVAGCDALFAVSFALPAKVIDRLSRCRIISRLGTGTDKIDVAAASKKGIIVTNVPTFCT